MVKLRMMSTYSSQSLTWVCFYMGNSPQKTWVVSFWLPLNPTLFKKGTLKKDTVTALLPVSDVEIKGSPFTIWNLA